MVLVDGVGSWGGMYARRTGGMAPRTVPIRRPAQGAPARAGVASAAGVELTPGSTVGVPGPYTSADLPGTHKRIFDPGGKPARRGSFPGSCRRSFPGSFPGSPLTRTPPSHHHRRLQAIFGCPRGTR